MLKRGGEIKCVSYEREGSLSIEIIITYDEYIAHIAHRNEEEKKLPRNFYDPLERVNKLKSLDNRHRVSAFAKTVKIKLCRTSG